VVCFVLDVAGLLPTVLVTASADVLVLSFPFDVQMSGWSPVPVLASVLALVLGPMLPAGRWDRSVFFDMACISQSDPRLKSEGIASLAGFLDKSKELIVLWSPHSLSRLWCVFEMAVYSALEGDDRRITFCPLFIFGICFAGYVFLGLSFFIFSMYYTLPTLPLESGKEVGLLAMMAGASSMVALLVHWGRSFMREKHRFLQELAHFDVENAQCREAADEQFIKQSIEHWYGSTASFNEFVRGPMAQKIDRAMQGLEGTYRTCVMMTAPQHTFALQWMASILRVGSNVPFAVIMSQLLWGCSNSFLILPVHLKMSFLAMERCQQALESRAADVALSTALSISLVLSYYSMCLFGAHVRDASFALVVAWVGVWTLLAYSVFSVPPASRIMAAGEGATSSRRPSHQESHCCSESDLGASGDVDEAGSPVHSV